MSRETVLEKLHALVDTSDRNLLPEDLPVFPQARDVVAEFRSQLERVDGRFLDARGPGRLLAALNETVGSKDFNGVAWETPGSLSSHGLTFNLPGTDGIRNPVYFSPVTRPFDLPIRLESRERTPATMAEIDVSVSAALYGIAETGTIVESSGSGVGRVIPIIPPVHVVLLSEKKMLSNHGELFRTLTPGEKGSVQILMTGPSRTADIEKTLVLGVHGPKQLVVILTS